MAYLSGLFSGCPAAFTEPNALLYPTWAAHWLEGPGILVDAKKKSFSAVLCHVLYKKATKKKETAKWRGTISC